MLPIHPSNARLWSMLGSRGTFGVAMLDAAANVADVMVLTADLCVTSGLERFRIAHPDKFLNVGIAEQNMIGIAAGLAKEGLNTFATTFSTFAAMELRANPRAPWLHGNERQGDRSGRRFSDGALR